jgi:hypothetical protein
MPWVGFEPTIPASERAKTVHALDRAAIVTDTSRIYVKKNYLIFLINVVYLVDVIQHICNYWFILLYIDYFIAVHYMFYLF